MFFAYVHNDRETAVHDGEIIPDPRAAGLGRLRLMSAVGLPPRGGWVSCVSTNSRQRHVPQNSMGHRSAPQPGHGVGINVGTITQGEVSERTLDFEPELLIEVHGSGIINKHL